MTLHHWQRLATPHMGGLLEDRPGVQIKGDRNIILDENDEVYDLSDYEEEGQNLLLYVLFYFILFLFLSPPVQIARWLLCIAFCLSSVWT